MATVKVFSDKQMDKRTGHKQYAPIYRCGGIKRNSALFENVHTTNASYLRF